MIQSAAPDDAPTGSVAPRHAPARRFGIVLLAALGMAAGGERASAQEGCEFGDRGNDLAITRTLPGIGQVMYVTRPHFVCQGGVQIFADSAVAYADRGMSHLMGSVRYVSGSRELLADTARYFTNEGRLQANGSVSIVDDEQGSSIRNGDLVYLLATDFREIEEMTITLADGEPRPTAVLRPPPPAPEVSPDAPPDPAIDPTGSPGSTTDGGERPPTDDSEPYTVVADRIFLRGQGHFTATGAVEIVRDSIFAYADSAEYDQITADLVLEGSARVDGSGYELSGRTVTMTAPEGSGREIRALREARLVGDGLLLTSARIAMFLEDDQLQRLVATSLANRADSVPGAGEMDEADLERPEAHVDAFVLTSDSLEVNAPGERIERVFAAGAARSVSTSQDSLNVERLPEIARTDWLEGDTVIVSFAGRGRSTVLTTPLAAPDSVPGADSAVASVATAIDSAVADSASGPPADTAAVATAIEGAVAVVDAAMDSATTDLTEATQVELPSESAADDGAMEVQEIVARVGARSLYRMPPDDSTARAGTDPPAVHYVMGDEIRILLDDGEVTAMHVEGQTRGVHLEPRRPSASAADSMAVDSLAADTAVADTGSVAGAREVSVRAPVVPQPSKSPQRDPGAARPMPKESPWTRR